MKQTIKLFAVLCMTLIVVLLMASCDDLSNKLPFGDETTPAETTPAETTPAETTPAETTPEETTPEVTTPEVTTPEVTTPDGTQPSEPPHYHEFVDGKCECGFVPPVLENESVYDNDGDGKNDVYLFTAALPEKFTGEDVIHVWGGDYVPELSRLYVIGDSFFPIREWSCPTGSGDYYVYKVTVPETGIYEMAIHTHLWATKTRGAKFTVNKDTENEYTFELSYQFTTEEASAAMENDYTRTSYMYGIQVELQAGDNYLRIDEPTQDLREFYFRDFYFVKVDDEIPHEHEFVDGKCECGFVPPVLENESVYDNDGDGKNDVYLFTAALPEKFRGENVVSVWCMDYIPELSTSYVSDKNMFSTIYTMYCEKEFDEYFTYKVTVPEAGVYEMAIHTRLKDTRARGAKFIINKDTVTECVFELSYQFATEEELNAARENDYTSTSYMYSIRVELQAGDNYIRVEGPTQDLRVFYFRDFYFVKVADLCTEHTWGETITQNPTRCEDGFVTRICVRCGHSAISVIKATHDLGPWYATVYSTYCLQVGEQQRKCKQCDYVETRTYRANHSLVLTEYITVPTCTEKGQAIYSCAYCGEGTKTINLSPLSNHVVENGFCIYCENVAVPRFEKESGYDNDGDGKNDIFYFSPSPEKRFVGEGVIYINALYYQPLLSCNYVPESMFSSGNNHVYFDEGKGQYAVYKITVPEAGIYEMAIHTRLRNTYERGGKYTVNEGTEHEYSFETSFQFATEEELYAARDNEYTMSSYMYGMYLELQEGDNYIKIELSSGGEKSMNWREFFFVKVADLCTEHTWGEWVTVTEPNCEEDGLQKRTCTKCYATEEAPIDDLAGFHVWRNPATIKTQITPCLQEWFDQCVCSNCGAVKSTNTRLFSTHKWGLTTVVKAPTCQEDGLTQKSCTVCGAVSETVTKASDHQWSKWQLINDIPCGEEGSQSERTCQTCGTKETHDNERACYVWINHTTLELGTCIQPGKVSEECQYCGKVQIRELQMAGHKWSEYVEVEPATCTQHGRKVKTCAVCGGTSDAQIYKLDHLYENGICTSCGHVEGSVTPTPIFEKESVYDNDGDGVNDTYLFSPIFPEKFENGDIIYINSGKYEKDLSSSIVGYRPYSGETQNSYWYCEEGKGQYIVYKITVAEAGVYEMAIRIRLHDTTERATKYTVNEGTEYEYSFETSYQFATMVEVYEAQNSEYDQSCYMYGMRFNLVEGDNYIKLEESSLIPKAIFSRDYYFVKVEE